MERWMLFWTISPVPPMRGKRRNWSKSFETREDALEFMKTGLPPESLRPGDGGRTCMITLQRQFSIGGSIDLFGGGGFKRKWERDGQSEIVTALAEAEEGEER